MENCIFVMDQALLPDLFSEHIELLEAHDINVFLARDAKTALRELDTRTGNFKFDFGIISNSLHGVIPETNLNLNPEIAGVEFISKYFEEREIPYIILGLYKPKIPKSKICCIGIFSFDEMLPSNLERFLIEQGRL